MHPCHGSYTIYHISQGWLPLLASQGSLAWAILPAQKQNLPRSRHEAASIIISAAAAAARCSYSYCRPFPLYRHTLVRILSGSYCPHHVGFRPLCCMTSASSLLGHRVQHVQLYVCHSQIRELCAFERAARCRQYNCHYCYWHSHNFPAMLAEGAFGEKLESRRL